METFISERVKQKYNMLTPSMKKVAKYIIYNLESTNNATASDIAHSTDVSEATVIRCIRTLGYNNFLEFRTDIQNLFVNDKRALRNLVNKNTLKEKDWLDEHFNQEAENIIATSKNITQTEIDICAEMLLKSNHIWLVGWRMGLSVIEHMNFTLKYMLGNCTKIPHGQEAEYASYINKGDTVFISSFPRYDKNVIKTAQIAKEKGAYVISITDSQESKIREYSNISFIANAFSYGFLDSYTAAVSVCNAIIRSLTYIGEERIKANIEEIERNYINFNKF